MAFEQEVLPDSDKDWYTQILDPAEKEAKALFKKTYEEMYGRALQQGKTEIEAQNYAGSLLCEMSSAVMLETTALIGETSKVAAEVSSVQFLSYISESVLKRLYARYKRLNEIYEEWKQSEGKTN